MCYVPMLIQSCNASIGSRHFEKYKCQCATFKPFGKPCHYPQPREAQRPLHVCIPTLLDENSHWVSHSVSLSRWLVLCVCIKPFHTTQYDLAGLSKLHDSPTLHLKFRSYNQLDYSERLRMQNVLRNVSMQP